MKYKTEKTYGAAMEIIAKALEKYDCKVDCNDGPENTSALTYALASCLFAVAGEKNKLFALQIMIAAINEACFDTDFDND